MLLIKKILKHPKLCSIAVLFFAFSFFNFKFFNIKNLNPYIPFLYDGGDTALIQLISKMIHSQHWFFFTADLGAPFGMSPTDFPAFLASNFDYFCVKIISHICGNWVLGFNLYFLSIPFLVSIISYFVIRNLKINHHIAVLCSLVYAYMPYMFLRQSGHNALATYQFVPLSFLLCFWLYEDEDYFNINHSFFHFSKNWIGILFCFLISNNGIGYYQYFTCFFLIIVSISLFLKSLNWKKIIPGLMHIFLIVVFTLANLLPLLIFGSGIAATRGKLEAEIYGMKITQLFLPNRSYGSELLKSVLETYQNAPVPNEGTEFLGLVGIIGFLILLIWIFISKPHALWSQRLSNLCELNLCAVLLGTVGGFGSLVCLFITQYIRGYNRISIFIAYLSILAFSIVLHEFTNYIAHKKSQKFYFVVNSGFIALCIFSIFTQYPGNKIDYKTMQASYESDHTFVAQIENQVSNGAMVYQLPYHAFPEAGTVNGMQDYGLLRGYLNSNSLRWSYGSAIGSDADLWNRAVGNLPVSKIVDQLVISGFEGIYIDRSAYNASELVALEKELEAVLQVQPIISENNALSFFEMLPYKNRKESNNLSYWQEYKKEVLMTYGNGISGVEGEKGAQWMWVNQSGELILFNQNSQPIKYPLQFAVATGYADKSNLMVHCNEISEKYMIDSTGTEVKLSLTLHPGKNVLKIGTDARQIVAPGDSRQLYMRLYNCSFL